MLLVTIIIALIWLMQSYKEKANCTNKILLFYSKNLHLPIFSADIVIFSFSFIAMARVAVVSERHLVALRWQRVGIGVIHAAADKLAAIGVDGRCR